MDPGLQAVYADHMIEPTLKANALPSVMRERIVGTSRDAQNSWILEGEML